jgi:hypothetical protein
MRIRARITLFRALLLLLGGVVALVVSFVLAPTPDTFMVLSNGHRVRTPADMQAVDYAIFILRIGGAVTALTGGYLAYRAWRPDQIVDGEDRPGPGYDRLQNTRAEGGDPAARAALTRRT